jgi:hypothetical protein
MAIGSSGGATVGSAGTAVGSAGAAVGSTTGASVGVGELHAASTRLNNINVNNNERKVLVISVFSWFIYIR